VAFGRTECKTTWILLGIKELLLRLFGFVGFMWNNNLSRGHRNDDVGGSGIDRLFRQEIAYG
jgi:hypothetical protein